MLYSKLYSKLAFCEIRSLISLLVKLKTILLLLDKLKSLILTEHSCNVEILPCFIGSLGNFNLFSKKIKRFHKYFSLGLVPSDIWVNILT